MILLTSKKYNDIKKNTFKNCIQVRFMHKTKDPKEVMKMIEIARNRFSCPSVTMRQNFCTHSYTAQDIKKTNTRPFQHQQLRHTLAHPNSIKLNVDERIADLHNRREQALEDPELPKILASANTVREDCLAEGIDYHAKNIPYHPQIIISGLLEGSASLSHSRISEEAQKKGNFYVTESVRLESNSDQEQYLHLRLNLGSFLKESQKYLHDTTIDWHVMDDLLTSHNIKLNEKNIKDIAAAVDRHNKNLELNKKKILTEAANEKAAKDQKKQQKALEKGQKKKEFEENKEREKKDKHLSEIAARKEKLHAMKQQQNQKQWAQEVGFNTPSNLENTSTNEKIHD